MPGALKLTLPLVIIFEEDNNASQVTLPPVLLPPNLYQKSDHTEGSKEIVILIPITVSSLGEDSLHVETIMRFLFCVSVKIWKKYVQSFAKGVR